MADKKVKAPKPPKTPKQPKKKKLKTYQQRQDRNGYAFMAPWIIGFLAFTAFPFIMTIYLSFTHVKATILGYDIDWVGLANYNDAFFKNEINGEYAENGYATKILAASFKKRFADRGGYAGRGRKRDAGTGSV